MRVGNQKITDIMHFDTDDRESGNESVIIEPDEKRAVEGKVFSYVQSGSLRGFLLT